MIVKLPYVKTMPRKKGPSAHYVQVHKRGRAIRLHTSSTDFPKYVLEYNEAVQLLKNEHLLIDHRRAAGSHTVGALLSAFKGAGGLGGLKPTTVKNYTYAFKKINQRFGLLRYDQLTKNGVATWLDEAPPFAANMVLRSFRRLINWALDRDYVTTDPTRGIKGNDKNKKGFPAWPEATAAKYCVRYPLGTHQRLCFDLLQYTGLRISDIIELGPKHIEHTPEGDFIRRVCNKTGNEINIPLNPQLKASIAASETGTDTFLRLRRFVRPYPTSNAFGEVFRSFCADAGIGAGEIERVVSGHGLRKTVAIRALENGATTHDVIAFQGWSTTAMVDHYARSIDRNNTGRRKGHLMFKDKPQAAQNATSPICGK